MSEHTAGDGFRFIDRRKRAPDLYDVLADPAVIVPPTPAGPPLDPERVAEFADAVDEARAARAIPLPPEVEQAIAQGKAMTARLLGEATGRDDLTVEYDRTPIDPAAPLLFGADGSPVTYVARCAECSQAGAEQGEPVEYSGIPFGSAADRDRWATAHARARRHPVTLAEQGPTFGTRLVGRVEPPPLPLVAFLLPEGGPPDLMCRIPERAGAAWLLTAAHACLLGRGGGSLGIATPHRAMFIGHVSTDGPQLHVTIGGVIGATDNRFGQVIDAQYQVDAALTPAQAEDVVEELISRAALLPRNLFSVVLMAAGDVGEPPDPEADEALRAARLADIAATDTRTESEVAAANAALLGVPLPHDPRGGDDPHGH